MFIYGLGRFQKTKCLVYEENMKHHKLWDIKNNKPFCFIDFSNKITIRNTSKKVFFASSVNGLQSRILNWLPRLYGLASTNTNPCQLLFCLPPCTVSPRSLDPSCIVRYYIKWAKTSWTYVIGYGYTHFYARIKSLVILINFEIIE